MTEKQRDNLLLDLKNYMNDMKADMNSMKADMNSMKADMNSMKADNKKRDSILLSLKNDMNDVKADINSMKADISHISGRVAVIEHEHGEKIQALLDGEVAILDKLDLFEKRFESDEQDIENHSIRIRNLESKVKVR